jgi:hypothetical protein
MWHRSNSCRPAAVSPSIPCSPSSRSTRIRPGRCSGVAKTLISRQLPVGLLTCLSQGLDELLPVNVVQKDYFLKNPRDACCPINIPPKLEKLKQLQAAES